MSGAAFIFSASHQKPDVPHQRRGISTLAISIWCRTNNWLIGVMVKAALLLARVETFRKAGCAGRRSTRNYFGDFFMPEADCLPFGPSLCGTAFCPWRAYCASGGAVRPLLAGSGRASPHSMLQCRGAEGPACRARTRRDFRCLSLAYQPQGGHNRGWHRETASDGMQ